MRDADVRWATELPYNLSQAYCEESLKLLLLGESTSIHYDLSFLYIQVLLSMALVFRVVLYKYGSRCKFCQSSML